jgi:probable rRNA maturation factor
MAVFEDSANNISIQRMTAGPVPSVPFVAIKNAVLGKKYELSVLFPDTKTSKKLHKQWKQKSTPVNVLSFPLDETSGEIIITLGVARKEAKKFDLSYQDYITFLFIHGLVHLKGFDHGDEMEAVEQGFRKKFGLV